MKIKYLLKFFKNKKNITLQFFALTFIVISNLSNLFLPSVLAKIMDSYFKTAIFETKQFYLVALIIVFATLSIFVANFLFSYLSEKLAFYLRSKLMTKIINQPQRYFIKNKPSKILTVLSSDINFIRNVFGRLASIIVTSSILLVGSLILMLSINLSLTLYILALIIVVITFVLFLFSKIKKLFKKSRKLRDGINKIIDENVKASMLIRVFVAQDFEKNKFLDINQKTLDVGLKTNKFLALIMPSIHFINLFSSLLIVVLGGKLVINQTMTLGQMTIFSNYVMMFTFSIVTIGIMSGMIGQATVSLDRVTSILSTKNNFKNGTKKLKDIKTVEFRNISLFIAGRQILKDINLKIKKGQSIALIGPTGSGKSVLLQLISRVLDPSSGQILINGQNILNYDINSIRSQLGSTFQDTFLFNDTIKNNIDFGRNLSQKDILWASQISLSTQFIKKVKNTFNYNIGEFGRKLSGGQIQRLSIARALATKPKLVILDDVTSNLDIASEKQIIKNIQTKIKGTTVILVSQKIASVKDSHRIYVFDSGQIVASGTHQQLSQTSPLYREISLIQKNYKNI